MFFISMVESPLHFHPFPLGALLTTSPSPSLAFPVWHNLLISIWEWQPAGFLANPSMDLQILLLNVEVLCHLCSPAWRMFLEILFDQLFLGKFPENIHYFHPNSC